MERHKRTAQAFARWLEAHPNAPDRKRYKVFNWIADREFQADGTKAREEWEREQRVKST